MKTKLEVMLNELTKFYNAYWGNKRQFTYAYGSHIAGYSAGSSDLDVVTVCADYSEKDIKQIKDFIINFHIRHNLEIDDEVPFEKKLICPYDMMCGAVRGEGFHYDKLGTPSVPELTLTQAYLQSDELMKRILLNTITSKSHHLSGSKEDYHRFEDCGWSKIIEVVFLMENNQPIDQNTFLELMIKKGTRVGRDYMGYMDKDCVRNYLKIRIESYFLKEVSRGTIIRLDNNKYGLNKALI